MMICGECKQPLEKGEKHHHLPDIFLNVWDGSYYLARTRDIRETIITEGLPFNIPKHWAEWVFDTCGGAINRSGIYRLPGMIWEWCLVKMQGEENMARFLEKNIENYLNRKKK